MYFDPNYVRSLKAQNAPKTPGNSSPNPPVGGAVYVIPGQGSGNANNDGANGMAIAGFVLSFLVPLLGFIFSIIGISNAKSRPDQKGMGLAVAGLVISCLFLLIYLIVGAICDMLYLLLI